MKQYIISHKPWPLELVELTNLEIYIKKFDKTTDPYSAPLTLSYSYDKLNENTYRTSKNH